MLRFITLFKQHKSLPVQKRCIRLDSITGKVVDYAAIKFNSRYYQVIVLHSDYIIIRECLPDYVDQHDIIVLHDDNSSFALFLSTLKSETTVNLDLNMSYMYSRIVSAFNTQFTKALV